MECINEDKMWSGINNFQVMQSEMLDYHLLFMDISIAATLRQKCHSDVISAKNTFMPKCISDNSNNQNGCLALLWTIVKHKTTEGNRCVFEPSARSSQAGCISLRDDSFKGEVMIQLSAVTNVSSCG